MMLYGWAIDRYGTGRLLALYQIPMALSFFLFGFGDSIIIAGFAFILFGITHGANSTIPGAFWAQKAPGIVEFAPWVIPKRINANPAIIIESPKPKRKNDNAMGI